MAQLDKALAVKAGGLGSDPQHPRKSWARKGLTVTLALGR